MSDNPAKRQRKSKEALIADLEAQKQKVEQQAKKKTAAFENKIKQLQKATKPDKTLEKAKNATGKYIFRTVPDWTPAQVLAAVSRCKQQSKENPALLAQLEQEGQQQWAALKGARGRKKA